MTQQTNRKRWLDALRGMAMIFVVYGHCVRGWSEYFVFTSPIKMPLFFAISAYLFNPQRGQKEFYNNMLVKIVIPWLILGMFPFVHPTERFLNLISGKVLWFMPCLVIAEIIWFYIRKISSNDLFVVVVGLLIAIGGLFISVYYPIRFCMIDTALVVQMFFVMGFLIKKYEDTFSINWEKWIPGVGILFIILGILSIVYFPNQLIDVHLNKYFNLPIGFLMMPIGCISLFILFKKIDLSPRWLVYIGQNTLVIYILHGFFIGGVYRLLCDIDIPLPLFGLVRSVTAIVSCCAISFLINKFIPELAGKKRVP